jgi:hypothetical protein
MQHTFKVGDKVVTKSMIPGTTGEIIHILDKPANNILVKRKSLTSGVDCVDFVSEADIVTPQFTVKAQKALACVEEIKAALSSAVTSFGFCERVETILRRYGQ